MHRRIYRRFPSGVPTTCIVLQHQQILVFHNDSRISRHIDVDAEGSMQRPVLSVREGWCQFVRILLPDTIMGWLHGRTDNG